MSIGALIRRLEVAEVPAVVEACAWLFAAPGSVPPLWDPVAAAERLEALVTAEGAVCFVAMEGSAVVGFVTAYLDLVSVRMGQRAWINELAVDPARRSRGVGKALFDVGKAWAVEHGATHVMLDSATARVDAHRFYAREEPSFQASCFGWVLP